MKSSLLYLFQDPRDHDCVGAAGTERHVAERRSISLIFDRFTQHFEQDSSMAAASFSFLSS